MTNSEPAADPPGRDVGAIRIGDAERNAAVEALGEHMTTGRLDLDEYGTRSASASAARTVGELRALFADLPAPHPPLPGPATAAAPLVNRGGTGVSAFGSSAAVAVPDDRSRAQKLVGAAVAVSGILALVLFFATDAWWWFLLIPAISTLAGSVWGDSWKRPDRRRGH